MFGVLFTDRSWLFWHLVVLVGLAGCSAALFSVLGLSVLVLVGGGFWTFLVLDLL